MSEHRRSILLRATRSETIPPIGPINTGGSTQAIVAMPRDRAEPLSRAIHHDVTKVDTAPPTVKAACEAHTRPNGPPRTSGSPPLPSSSLTSGHHQCRSPVCKSLILDHRETMRTLDQSPPERRASPTKRGTCTDAITGEDAACGCRRAETRTEPVRRWLGHLQNASR